MAKVGDEIINPRTGQRMIFRETAAETAGELLRIECYSPPSTAREPEHIHPRQESRFEVLSGTLHFRVWGKEQTCGPGDVTTIPAGAPHFFWNDGGMEARYFQEFRPALKIEAFFEKLFSLAQEGRLDSKGSPGILQMALTGPMFWDEIRVTQPPQTLQRIAFRVIGPVARMLGYRP